MMKPRRQLRTIASLSKRLQMVEREISEMTAPAPLSYYRFLIRNRLVRDRRIPAFLLKS